MFNLISIVFGVVAFPVLLLGLIPLLGWLQYLTIVLGVIGLAFGVLSSHTSGRNLNIVVLVVGAIRLMLGGGLF